jgi:hypothetical protein
MSEMISGFQKINLVLKQLMVSCDPYIFFSALRVFLGSYKDGKGRAAGTSLKQQRRPRGGLEVAQSRSIVGPRRRGGPERQPGGMVELRGELGEVGGIRQAS